jgi:hypothetical protein
LQILKCSNYCHYNIGGANATVEVAASSNTTVAALTTATRHITANLPKVSIKLRLVRVLITGKSCCYWQTSVAPTVIFGPTTVCNVAVQPLSSKGGGI